MKKHTPFSRHLFSFILTAFMIVGCGGNAYLTDYDVLKNEGEASGQEIPVGTYDSKAIVFGYKNEDSPISSVNLYVALDFSGDSIQSRHNRLDVEEYCYFLPELEEGRFQSATVTFEYEATLDLEAGTASEISAATASSGSVTAGDTTYVEGFLDAAAESLKGFLSDYREYKSRTEEWLVDKLEEIGYVLNSNYDRDSLDYYENQIFTNYGITVSIQKRYVGYINQSQRFCEILIFENEEQCAAYFYKVWPLTGNKNYNYHAHNENVYFFTSSFETIQATFPSNGNQP